MAVDNERSVTSMMSSIASLKYWNNKAQKKTRFKRLETHFHTIKKDNKFLRVQLQHSVSHFLSVWCCFFRTVSSHLFENVNVDKYLPKMLFSLLLF